MGEMVWLKIRILVVNFNKDFLVILAVYVCII